MSTTVTFAGNLADAPELHHTRENNKPFVTCRSRTNNGMSQPMIVAIPAHHPLGTATATTQALKVDGVRRLVVLSGQVAHDGEGSFVGDGDVAAQLIQVYKNLQSILESADGGLQNLISTTTYLTSVSDIVAYREAKLELSRTYWNDGPYPTNSVVVVSGLAHPRYRVEVSGLAVL